MTEVERREVRVGLHQARQQHPKMMQKLLNIFEKGEMEKNVS